MENIKRINYIISTHNQKIFSLSTDLCPSYLYFANTDLLTALVPDKTIDGSLCFELFKNNSSKTPCLIHNIYKNEDVWLKSAIYRNTTTNRTGTSYDFHNITDNKNGYLLNGILCDNTAYLLKSAIPYGRYTFDVYQELSGNNGRTYITDNENTDISTIIYDYAKLSELLSSENGINYNEVIKTNLSGINYNRICEIPGDISNDYLSSNICTNTYKTKNQYNSEFNMSHDNDNILKNSRNYLAIDKCNNHVYLKYTDNISYKCAEQNVTEDKSIQSILVNVNSEQTTLIHELTYQHIESIKNVNRLENMNNHKSNLFSVSINTNMLEALLDKVKSTVINEIKNITRDIVENIAPVNTLLFKIFVNGN